ncbi:CoA-transferase subunit beta [Salisediminibacterium selenitireducens]|uniref:Coenzyme A transferase n=1 Tax=Bacillus selenitireducens (strain ATCC 700615 / DSM 15326 / MLS10) TaxID=439292 RepID=D6Y0M0_BACIE|nr:CoA-transferase [Salisediminibacterium selenitireducens]ADI00588.1 coenzyme A transferase [[Bacillus] selenitireducens MLS10]
MNRQADSATADMMTCVMARFLQNEETVFHGVSSHMPMVAMMLARSLHAPDLVHLNIPGGVNPATLRNTSYSSAGPELARQAESAFSLADIFDLSMRGKLDVAFLGGVQFDQYGNVNASLIGDAKKPKVKLPGGAGSAVLIPTAKKAIIWRAKHDVRTFVEDVDFITTRGNLYKIVTPLCVFGYRNGRLYLDSVHAGVTVDDVKKQTGFPIHEQDVPENEPPTLKERTMLKRIDPNNLRAVEF